MANLNTIQTTISQILQQIPSLVTNHQIGLIQSTNLRHKVQPSFPLLLLKLQGDTSNGSVRDSAHKMGGESGNLVAHAFGGCYGDLIDYAFVGVEIEG